jgi:hypothetical protein
VDAVQTTNVDVLVRETANLLTKAANELQQVDLRTIEKGPRRDAVKNARTRINEAKRDLATV